LEVDEISNEFLQPPASQQEVDEISRGFLQPPTLDFARLGCDALSQSRSASQ